MAEARLAAILAGDDARLVNITPSHVTFGEACDELLRYLEHDKQRKRSTIRDARSTINAHLLEEFGNDKPVEDITTTDIGAYRDRLLLSVEQVHAVARAAANDQVAALVTVAALTGLRQGELLALRWRHVDFANRILHVRRNLPSGTFQEDTPKSHRVRSVPLSDQTIVALDGLSRREHFTEPDDLVFVNDVGGHLLDDVVRDAFYDALEAADLEHLRAKEDPIVFHDLRHTFGTQCAAKGIDLRRIQAWTGHADIQTTMRYLHYVPQHDDAARLTAAFGAEPVNGDRGRTPQIGIPRVTDPGRPTHA